MSCHWPLVSKDCEKPHLGLLLRASGPFLNSDLDLGYSVSLCTAPLSHCSQSQLCSPLSGIVGTLGEVPACSPLAQPCCVLTLRHPFWGSPELEASRGLCAAVYTTHKQAFPLSFNVPVPVAAGWWLEAGAAGTENTCPTEGCWTARTAQLHPHPSNQGTINCWSTLDRLLERASSTWVTPEPNPEHSLV